MKIYKIFFLSSLLLSSCGAQEPTTRGTGVVRMGAIGTVAKSGSTTVAITQNRVLGHSLSPDRIANFVNWKIDQLQDGISVHVFYTNPENITYPSYIVVNKVSSGKVDTLLFPITDTIKKRGAEKYIEESDPKTVFDPILSPNGKYIAFKYGEISSPGSYRVCVLDLTTEECRIACVSYLTYNSIGWSPDSNYLVFGRGGDVDPTVYENGRSYNGVLEVCVCNWKTGKVHIVAKTSSAQGPWSWKAPHSLVYSCLSLDDEILLSNSNYEAGIDFVKGKPVAWERLKGGQKHTPVAPNIYEYSIEKSQSRMIIKNGRLPQVSADGKKVAFFSSIDPYHPFSLREDWIRHPDQVYTTVSPLSANSYSNRITLDEYNTSYPQLLWADSNNLLVVDQTSSLPKSQLQIKEWDTAKSLSHNVAILTATDPDAFRSESDPAFQVLSIMPDGKHLMCQVNEHYYPKKFGGAFSQDTLEDIDVDSGKVSTVGVVRNSIGLGWSYTKP